MIKSDLQTLIFDFDGVIVESMKNNHRAWDAAFKAEGIPFEAQEYFLLEGIKPVEVAQHFLKKANVPETSDLIGKLTHAKEQAFQSGPKTMLYQGVKDFLVEAKERKMQTALVSGGGRKRILGSLQEHGIGEMFDYVVSADDVQFGKPHPEPFLKAIQYTSADPEATLVVENAPLGIKAAKAAGLKVVAIGSTLGENNLKEADLFLNNHDMLFNWLRKYWSK